MNWKKLATMVLATFAVLLLAPHAAHAADDGATLYKSKCAPCHGTDGAGKPAVKAPSLISDEAKAKSDADMTDAIANGGPSKKAMHAFASKGMTADQVKAVVSAVRDMQKK